MKIKELINELQKLDLEKEICVVDMYENIYTYDFEVSVDYKIILPLHILDHEWREDIAKELYGD